MERLRMERLIFSIVGDNGVGVTNFLCRWVGDYFNWSGHIHRYSYNGNRTHEINGKKVDVCLSEKGT